MEDESKISVDHLIEKAGDLLETKYELIRLKGIQKLSDGVSSVASTLVTVVIGLIFVMVINIGIALLLGEWLGKNYYGFFALAGFYLIAGLIFRAFKSKWVKDPITDIIIRKAFK